MGDKNKFRERIRDAISKVASAYSVSSTDKDIWRKENGWKTDEVHLGFKETYFYVNIYVNLPPCLDTPFEFETLAMFNLPTLCGNSDAVYRYPLLGFQASRLIARIEADLKTGMEWFETLNTPQNCLAYLRADAGNNPQSKAYLHCESYLGQLISPD